MKGWRSQEVTILGSIKLSNYPFAENPIWTVYRLEIEKGCHIKLKPEERICKLCKSDIETELHFIQDSQHIVIFGHIFLEIIPHVTGPKFCNARITKVLSILQIF